MELEQLVALPSVQASGAEAVAGDRKLGTISSHKSARTNGTGHTRAEVPTSLPFGPRAPPTAWVSTIQATDLQLQDTRDGVVCHPSLQAEPRNVAWQGR